MPGLLRFDFEPMLSLKFIQRRLDICANLPPHFIH